MTSRADFIVVGAGSAGCIAAAELARREAGSVLLLEAGPTDNSPLVKMPFGLVWMMGSARRDWCYKSTPQQHLGDRQLNVTRGRMVGGSGSINSMVWFRGRKDDFDNWQVPGWSWTDVASAFEAVEAKLTPNRMEGAHPLTEALHSLFPEHGTTPPSPEHESAGVFAFNMVDGRRRSAADGFIKPAPLGLTLVTGHEIDRVLFKGDTACGVRLTDGTELQANKGVVVSAGAIGSPSILMRSGIGPRADLEGLGIEVRHDAEEVGANLHDHPAAGLHFSGPGSGYGVTPSQMPGWAIAPFQYLMTRGGRFASPTVEGGGFFNARGLDKTPAVQSDEALLDHIRDRGATAYHPVGILRMGKGTAPVTPRLSVRGVQSLWVADASVMPAVTSANTNAPSMMIGYRAGELISEDCA